MKKLTVEELKKTSCDILKYIDAFCKTHNFTYWAAGGTLLGAIRHQGFIPWDDDIDLCMPYTDYIQFIHAFSKETGRYQLISYPENNDYYQPFIKVVDARTVLQERIVKNFQSSGVFVDIFPICGLSNSIKSAKALICKAQRNSNLNYIITEQHHYRSPSESFTKYLLVHLFRIVMKIDSHHFQKKILKSFSIYPLHHSNYLGCPVGAYGEKEILEASIFSDSISVTFQDMQIPAPIGYHTYLTSLYGDYMTLPPVEKRNTTHSFQAFWKDTEPTPHAKGAST